MGALVLQDGSVTPNVDTLYSSGWLDLSQVKIHLLRRDCDG